MQCLFSHCPKSDPKMWSKTDKLFHTSHKSFNFAAFCCWGEVVVPSDPPEIQRINKTSRHPNVIMMRVEPEHTEWTSATCSSVKILFLFYCFTVAVYFLVSFPFMVVIRVCFRSRAKFPLKVSRCTCRYCFNFYLHYHHIVYSSTVFSRLNAPGVYLKLRLRDPAFIWSRRLSMK